MARHQSEGYAIAGADVGALLRGLFAPGVVYAGPQGGFRSRHAGTPVLRSGLLHLCLRKLVRVPAWPILLPSLRP